MILKIQSLIKVLGSIGEVKASSKVTTKAAISASDKLLISRLADYKDGQLFNYRDNRDYFIGNNQHRVLFID